MKSYLTCSGGPTGLRFNFGGAACSMKKIDVALQIAALAKGANIQGMVQK
jgi:hypothetical protein